MFDKLDLILPEQAFCGPMQMALDEVLLKHVTCPTLRLYRWEAPCVSFGYFQKFDEVRSFHPSLPLVRRWTGGGMVVHGNDLTFSLLIPRECAAAKLTPSLFYKNLHHTLAESLANYMKRDIQLAGEKEILSGPSCFGAPSRDDLLCEGTKILGGAQRRSAGALLYQGSLQGMGLGNTEMLRPVYLASSLSCSFSIVKVETNITSLKETLLHYRSDSWNKLR